MTVEEFITEEVGKRMTAFINEHHRQMEEFMLRGYGTNRPQGLLNEFWNNATGFADPVTIDQPNPPSRQQLRAMERARMKATK